MMGERKILIIICILAVGIIAILSLGCGVIANVTGVDRELPVEFGGILRRAQAAAAEYLILIDPGHGGMDGGASSSDGTLEKDINLAIAKKLAAAAEQYDCRVMLTRENDQWLCETDEGSIRSRKTADLAARRDMIDKYEPDIVISIHLNSFKEDPSVKGAQVFYPPSGADRQESDASGDTQQQDTQQQDVQQQDGHQQDTQSGSRQPADVLQQCRLLAETMQNKINETLQPENPRTAMTRDGVFIFKTAERPVIIIECGFMSNQDEAALLKTDEYQQELAMCIMSGIAEFAGLEKAENIEFIDSSR